MNEEQYNKWLNDEVRGFAFVTKLIKEGKYDEYIKNLDRKC
jgi:hypothetical protein